MNPRIKLKRFFASKFSQGKGLFSPLSMTGDRLTRISIGVNFALVVAQVVLVSYFGNLLPREIPLFYSRPWGEFQLAQKPNLWLLPFLSTVTFLANLILANFLATQNLLAKTLVLAASLFCLLSTITLIKIVTLVSY